jgi:hypothetical protein
VLLLVITNKGAIMEKTLSEANKIQSELLTFIADAHELLATIHAYGPADLDRDKLWDIRARVQDALRAMHDLQGIRKGLPLVHQD